MKIEHLEERITEYRSSIKTVVKKRITWENSTKDLIVNTLKKAETTYPVGWKVQEFKWIHTNEAVNITFDSFPEDLIEFTNKIPTYQFLQGGALVFSQLHNGDIEIFVTFPILENWIVPENEIVELGVFTPDHITEKLIVEKIDEFLKEIIKWEIPIIKSKLGFKTQ
ncbi:hypothetical protein [Salegentibacter salarius]|uniref:Uncharacterized protein n=1 Tax=Salegentibacter salarius TaxID=435906 RepID=A0A2N0U5D5_9FLAO|nr:hypothetical protein [Salegentibacter salarius]OEY73898.1 hypothetical protein BHS39_00280 [Salegentibacter salarius]PKD22098.1 hypothetical protein APR40_00280 [Salegentibacter salarius]SLJ86439.1 hypothetical protein SAMN05660445_00198 [Salegentibacter salarius]